MVVGIERGRLVPAAIVAAMLDKPLGWIRLRLRDDHHEPIYEEPRLEHAPTLPRPAPGRVIVVGDASVTGTTLRHAADHLPGYDIMTLTLRGNADQVAFPEMRGCVNWPWSPMPVDVEVGL